MRTMRSLPMTNEPVTCTGLVGRIDFTRSCADPQMSTTTPSTNDRTPSVAMSLTSAEALRSGTMTNRWVAPPSAAPNAMLTTSAMIQFT